MSGPAAIFALMITRRTALVAIPTLAAMSMSTPSPANSPLTVFELRNYQTQPGRRDELISMFEAHFLDAYARAGTTVIGTFRNPDNLDRWFWIRAFPDNASRVERLKGFYTSQDWLSRADACNATIADVSDALLLRTAITPSIALPSTPQEAAISVTPTASQIEISFFPLKDNFTAASEWFAANALPVLTALGQTPVLVLAPQPRDAPAGRQPLRDDPVLAVVFRHASAAAFDAAGDARAKSALWRKVADQFAPYLSGPVERRRLMPSLRSWLR